MSNPLVRYDNEHDAAGNPLYLNRYGQVCDQDGRTVGGMAPKESSVVLWAKAFAEEFAKYDHLNAAAQEFMANMTEAARKYQERA